MRFLISDGSSGGVRIFTARARRGRYARTAIKRRENTMADNNDKRTSNRGFASMDSDKQREIARKGGKASGGNFKNDPQRASEAGKKGGSK